MDKYVTILLLSAAAITIAGCSSKNAKEKLGIGRQSPDEFAVVERAPLTLPPSYTLQTPQPGAPRPQETSTAEQARALITGTKIIETGNMTAGEIALVQQAGAGQADPNIRRVLNQEYGVVPEGTPSERTVDKLIPMLKKDDAAGKVIDPMEEADTLREKGVNTPKPVTHEEAKEKE